MSDFITLMDAVGRELDRFQDRLTDDNLTEQEAEAVSACVSLINQALANADERILRDLLQYLAMHGLRIVQSTASRTSKKQGGTATNIPVDKTRRNEIIRMVQLTQVKIAPIPKESQKT